MKPMRLLFPVFLCLLCGSARAVTPITTAPPPLDAKAYLLIDYHSGRVLAEKNADLRLQPASLTKLMTTLVVAEYLSSGEISLEDPVNVSKKAWKAPGSRMFIEPRSQVTVQDLLLGVIVQSGNDASIALAEHVSSNEALFAAMMNRYAGELGMANSHFTNSSGLPEEELYSTARDMATLLAAMIRQHPAVYDLHSIREHEYGGIRQANRNRLLWIDERVDGGKTGHTEEAGYCLVVSATEGDMRLVSVVMGAATTQKRFDYARILLDYGFRQFRTVLLHPAHEPIGQPRVWKGAKDNVPVGPKADLYVTIPRSLADRLAPGDVVADRLMAPIAKGSRIAHLRLTEGERELLLVPLIALEDVEQGNLFTRLVDGIRLFFD